MLINGMTMAPAIFIKDKTEDYFFFTPGTHRFVIPLGARSVDVTCIGAGGGPGFKSPYYNAGPGGGASGFITHGTKLSVTPLSEISITVGAGGAPGTIPSSSETAIARGASGGASSCLGVVAAGGQGGVSNGPGAYGRGGNGGFGGGGGGCDFERMCGNGGRGYNSLPGDSTSPDIFVVYAKRAGGGGWGAGCDGKLGELSESSNNGGVTTNITPLYCFNDQTTLVSLGRGGNGGWGTVKEGSDSPERGYPGYGGHPARSVGTTYGDGGDGVAGLNATGVGSAGKSGCVAIRVWYVDR